jgi:hypothetical protein
MVSDGQIPMPFHGNPIPDDKQAGKGCHLFYVLLQART